MSAAARLLPRNRGSALLPKRELMTIEELIEDPTRILLDL